MFAAACLSLIWGFGDGVTEMVRRWETSEEYGYGYMIPVIAVFFIWQKKNELAELPFPGSWFGVALLLFSAVLLLAGDIASLFTVVQYAFILAIMGIALAYTGWSAFKLIVVPLFILFFMVPLPNFIYQTLSSELQLISSELGVGVIRLFGISVYLEGNVIDLGTYKLQVVEACSGLRYLFPLTSLAFIAAYLFKGVLWKKIIIFLSSIPITILMNSFRIGVIGALVEYGGPEQAEGFLHDFEGWVVFMGCMGVLIIEMSILSKIGANKLSLAEAFAIDFPEPVEKEGLTEESRAMPMSFLVAIVITGAITLAPLLLDSRSKSEYIPPRVSFTDFPMVIGDWEGKRDQLESIVLDVLKLEDYIIADYTNSEGHAVNFYIAYYESQKKGESAHSPRSCIPGGGWQISSHERELIPVGSALELSLVNRLVIEKGEYKQLVYYWFQGRSRTITNEYMVKWYMFQDALTQNRTDGALVRLITTVLPGQTLADADERLTEFARQAAPLLPEYIPE